MTGNADQDDVIRLITDPASHGGAEVERIDTHGAIVVLAGDHAWKLKRAVKFPFMDLSTADLRRIACEAEVRLNSRTAPDIYRRAMPVTRAADGGLAVDGAGAPVDWLVEMARFDQDCLLDRMAARGDLSPALVRHLADAIAAFHGAAEVRTDKGGADAMRWIVDDNIDEFREMADLCDSGKVEALAKASHEHLARVAGLLDARRAAGRVRYCHGDLHLRNVVVVDGQPTLFDCIEFSEDIACTDVLYDLAFLLMDLHHRDMDAQANAVLNRYLDRVDERGGLAALPLFLSCRAAVRAKVSALNARVGGDTDMDHARATVNAYLDIAIDYLAPDPPMLVAIGGRSGSGKSSLASVAAPDIGRSPGAVVVRSDVERKRLLGLAPEEPAPDEAYASDVSARVYGLLYDTAANVLAQGRSVVLDATFDRLDGRERAETVARDLDVPFLGVWLDADEDVLVARVTARAGDTANPDASDADAAVVRRQLRNDPGEMTWLTMDAARPLQALHDDLKIELDKARAGST